MKIIAAPDSFKGSLSAAEAAGAIARGIGRVRPDAEVISLPLADGGEGMLEALLSATGGRRVTVRVTGPQGTPVDAAYGLLGASSEIAVVEMAQAAGLGLMPEGERDPRRTTTYGVGELLGAAAQSGAREIIVGLGGSATNDGGAGAMQALGARFWGEDGELLSRPITGADMARLARIDLDAFQFPVGEVAVRIASDVTNRLLGTNGASAVYGPQKGATPEIVAELDAALSHYAGILKRDLGRDVALRPGAGAAGGLGAGLMAFLGAEMQSGIDLVLEAIGFDAQVSDAAWVMTGEGKIDWQTTQGKVIAGVLRHCAPFGVTVIAFGGSVDENAAEALRARGLRAAFPIVSGPMTLAEAMRDGARLLEDAAARVTRLLTFTVRRP